MVKQLKRKDLIELQLKIVKEYNKNNLEKPIKKVKDNKLQKAN